MGGGSAAGAARGRAVKPASLAESCSVSRNAAALGAVALVCADFAVLFASHFTAYRLRAGLLSRYGFFQGRGDIAGYEAYLFFVCIYLAVFAFSGLYTRRMSSIEDAASTLRACFYSTACALMLASLAHISEVFSRAVIAISAALAACAVPLSRYAVKSALGRWRRWARPLVLIGVNSNGLRAARDISSDRTTGYRIAGIVTEGAPGEEVPWPVWVMPDRRQAIALCRKSGVRSVLLCERESDDGTLEHSLALLEKFADDIKIASAFDGLHSLKLESEVLRSSYLLSHTNPLHRPANRVLKRFVDVAGALSLGVLFLPALIFVPLMVRMTSPGPALYGSGRIGYGGRRFRCWKFRTMYNDADQRLLRILTEDGDAARQYAEHCKLQRDPRITPLGVWLRRISLDELPQLWNVLRGDMSLVGPRPILPEEAGRFDPELANYFRVRGGLTGLWQISGRSDLSYAERMRLDQFYVRNWSIWLDAVILARTAWQLVRPRGAY